MSNEIESLMVFLSKNDVPLNREFVTRICDRARSINGKYMSCPLTSKCQECPLDNQISSVQIKKIIESNI